LFLFLFFVCGVGVPTPPTPTPPPFRFFHYTQPTTQHRRRERVFVGVVWCVVCSEVSLRETAALRASASQCPSGTIVFLFLFFVSQKIKMFFVEVLAFWRTLRSSGRREASRMRYLLRCGPASRRPTHPPHPRCGGPPKKKKKKKKFQSGA
jgi:hypothetical protein